MTKLLSKSDKIILDELCRNGEKYLKVDISSLAKTTRLARNTISSRIENLLKTQNLKLIAAENLELQGYEKVFVTITTAPEMTHKEYIEMVDFIRKIPEVESLFQLGSSDFTSMSIGIIIAWRAPFKKVGSNAYLRDKLWRGPMTVMQRIIAEKYRPKIKEIKAQYIANTDKLLFHYRFARYDPETGEMKP